MKNRSILFLLLISLVVVQIPFIGYAEDALQSSNQAKFKCASGDNNYIVAVKEDGTVMAWGRNGNGQCNVPEGLKDVKSVSSGDNFTVALKEDGSVVAWGLNDKNQCRIPSGVSKIKAIAVGESYTLALKENGTVIAWGDSKYGQCTVPEGLSGIKAIAAQTTYAAALKEDGTVIVWGEGDVCNVPDGLTDVESISAGSGYILALKDDKTLTAWGYNGCSICEIPAGLSDVKAIYTRDGVAVAIREDGTIKVWGSNKYELCNIPEGLKNVKDIYISYGVYNYVLALKEDGTVVAWGGYYFDITRLTNVKYFSGPAVIRIDGSIVTVEDSTFATNNMFGNKYICESFGNIKDISTGDHHTIILKEDGTVYTWGYNNQSEYTKFSKLTNIKYVSAGFDSIFAIDKDGTAVISDWEWSGIPETELRNVKAIGSGENHYVILKTDGTLSLWGSDIYDQCSSIPSGLKNVKAIAVGRNHTVALKEDGTVVAWGLNDGGQCNVPEGLKNVKAIAAGDEHSVALKEDGTLVYWGNTYDWGSDCIPMPKNLTNIKAIAAGWWHTVALKEDGTIVSWGCNSYYVLNIPPNLKKVRAISARGYETGLLLEDDTIVTLGSLACVLPPLHTRIPHETFNISGCILPDGIDPNNTTNSLKAGFMAGINGTSFNCLSDINGYFELPNIPESQTGYSLTISKPSYLSRTIKLDSLTMNKQVSTVVYPLNMYAGDLNSDNAINISDVMLIATAFNSSLENPRYEPEFDLNVDGAINIVDVMIIAHNFNKTALV